MRQMSEQRRKSDYDDLLLSESITDLQLKYGKIKQLEYENGQLKKMVKIRDNEINELKREIHKLKVSRWRRWTKTIDRDFILEFVFLIPKIVYFPKNRVFSILRQTIGTLFIGMAATVIFCHVYKVNAI